MMKKYGLLFLALFILGLTLAFMIKNTLDAKTEYEWPSFSMTFRTGSDPKTAITQRLTWYSKKHWILEILDDQMKPEIKTEPVLNYSGARYEFNNGEYIVYDPNSKQESRTTVAGGAYMSPAEWIFPGYEQQVGRSNEFKQFGTTQNSQRMYLSERHRICAKQVDGSLFDPTCNEAQTVRTELTFDSHGIPLFRKLSLDSQVLESYEVLSFEIR